MSAVRCPQCDATIQPPGGRRDRLVRCPWCNAKIAPEAPPPAPPPEPEPPKAVVAERSQPTKVPVRREDAAKPKGGNEIAVAAFVLGVCTLFAVGMFFLARYLTASAADALGR